MRMPPSAARPSEARRCDELGDNAFGQRGGRVKDPLGNIWWVTQQVETVPEDVMWHRLQQPEYADNMRYAQESLDEELSGSAAGRSSAPRQGSGDRS